MTTFASFIGCTLFASIFLFIDRLDKMDGNRRRLLLTAFSGVAIAYLFLDVMPHLASKQSVLLAVTDGGLYGYLEHHAYLVALAGFALYLSSMVCTTPSDRELEPADRSGFAGTALKAYSRYGPCAYIMLIAYMLVEQPDHRHEPVAIFTLAMAIHMLGFAHFVRDRLGPRYDRVSRYTFAAAAYCGWVLGIASEVPDTTYALWFSFLAGGIVGISVTSELRLVTTRKDLGLFTLGATAFSSLLLLFEHFSKLG